MRTIAIEEHFSTPQYQAAMKKATGRDMSMPVHMADVFKKLLDLGEGRLADMDAAGMDMLVLSLSASGLDQLDQATGASLVRECNDALAEAVKAHPDRFAGFAHLAMQEP